jgi:hypothetical protein
VQRHERRHPQRPSRGHVLRRDLAGVLQLDGDACPVRVGACGEGLQSGEERVVRDGDLVRNAGASREGDGTDTDDDQADAALGARS